MFFGAATHPSAARLRVGLIGTGRRGAGNFLPALACMRDRFTVEWIHSRRTDRLGRLAKEWNVEPIAELDDRSLGRIDVAAVTVPIDQNPVVLHKLQPHASRLAVVIDTPIAQSIRGVLKCARLLSQFNTVLIAEDYMNFPEFELIRRSVDDGLIGPVVEVRLDGLGYRYHGLALLRSFVDFDPVQSTRRHCADAQACTVRYGFGGGMHGCVVGPYRRDSGTITVIGDYGTISSAKGVGRKDDWHSVGFERDGDDVISATVIESSGRSDRLELPEIARLRTLTPGDRSDLNLRRSWGLMQVFQALHRDNLNRQYGFRNALSDSVVSRVAEKLPALFDPLAYAGTSMQALLFSGQKGVGVARRGI